MSAPTSSLVPALTESIAIVRDRDLYKAALDQINVAACYASEEDPGAVREALLHIGELARAALKGSQP